MRRIVRRQRTRFDLDCINFVGRFHYLGLFLIGDYRIGLKFNDRHIPDSPFKVYVSPAMGEAHKLEIAQFPSGAVQADKPAQFMVRKNGAKGDLDAKVGSSLLMTSTRYSLSFPNLRS